MWVEADADAGGVRIRYRVTGAGPTLLLVHATGFHGLVWEPWVPRLAERSRVITLDQRGHGDSEKPPSGYDWTGFGADILAVVDAADASGAAGVGHSAGAAALIHAEAARPGTFRKLVLMDPVLISPDMRAIADVVENPMAEAARRRRAIWDSREEMAARLRDGTPLAEWRDDFLRAYVDGGTIPTEDGRFVLKCPPEIEAQVYEGSGRHDGYEKLSRLTCPVLFMAGERSHMWASPRRDEAAAQLRHGELAVIDGGHFFPMENPDATLDAVLDFLDA